MRISDWSSDVCSSDLEQFYIFFPWFLVLLLRWRRAWLAGAVALGFAVSLAASIYGTAAAPSATFYLLPTRGWELLFGVALAINLVPALRSDEHTSELPSLMRLSIDVFCLKKQHHKHHQASL